MRCSKICSALYTQISHGASTNYSLANACSNARTPTRAHTLGPLLLTRSVRRHFRCRGSISQRDQLRS